MQKLLKEMKEAIRTLEDDLMNVEKTGNFDQNKIKDQLYQIFLKIDKIYQNYPPERRHELDALFDKLDNICAVITDGKCQSIQQLYNPKSNAIQEAFDAHIANGTLGQLLDKVMNKLEDLKNTQPKP